MADIGIIEESSPYVRVVHAATKDFSDLGSRIPIDGISLFRLT